ncbi:MAG: DUF4493 domain-containing protein [Bacteroidales bacterium]|nr:DUF4493 domain-containing protein [Bacteroidales bacterium]
MKHLKTIMSVLTVLVALSCTKSQTDGNGQVSFRISSRPDVVEQTRSSVSDYTALPSAGDFTISIIDESSAPVWRGKMTDWNQETLLPVGNYTVTAAYGALEDEGFDKPFFTGSNAFAINGGQTTEVPVTVSLSNTIVKVACTDNFKNYYKDYTFKIVRGGSDVVTFVKGETKAAFVDGYRFTLTGTLKSETGTKTFEKEYSFLDEATAYTFEFDVTNVGGASISVTFNNNVEVISLDDLELND